MGKTIVCYFSASGVTKKVAKNIASVIDADVFEIEPKDKYTDADLNWMDSNSRSSVEMKNRSYRPPIKNKLDDISKYDTIIIGFPVWWYTAPTIINTFLESLDFTGKKIVPFCTSGSSGIEDCQRDLQKAYPNYIINNGKRLKGNESADFIKGWLR